MTLVFRDHEILVVSIGSKRTQIQLGLEESLPQASYNLDTVVYEVSDGQFAPTGTPEQEVRPVVYGEIANQAAFHYLLKIIYRTASANMELPPALYLITSSSWNRRQMEHLTKYIMEEIRAPAVAYCLQGVCSAYAYALNTCVVIDVGFDKTEITAVHDYDALRPLSRVVHFGGQQATNALQKAIPELSSDQAEDLKLSGICEVLSEDSHRSWQNSAFENIVGETEDVEGVVDVAAIVSSGRTREILEQREKQKMGQTDAADTSNAEKETNTFTDRDGTVHTVGRERFYACEELISKITTTVGQVVELLEPHLRQLAWDNLILTGRGALVPGFKSELVARLEAQFLLVVRSSLNDIVGTSTIGAIALNQTQRQMPDEWDSAAQSPTSIHVAKIPEYFPQWKGSAQHEVSFLGALIGAKQTFTTGTEGLSVTNSLYNKVGPPAVADVYL